MKRKEVTHVWKKSLSMGLSLAMAVTLLPTTSVYADDPVVTPSAPTAGTASTVTPALTKGGSFNVPQDGSTKTLGQPFAKGTAGSEKFRIPTILTMNNGEIIAVADARYTHGGDGFGIDTIASVSSDFGNTWDFSFPYMFPDSKGSVTASNNFAMSSIDTGLVEGPDGTLYLIADAYPMGYNSMANPNQMVAGTGYVEIDGQDRLVLTDDYSKVTTRPTEDNIDAYPYYVGDFESVNGSQELYARIYKRSDNAGSEYAIDEYYNLYHVTEDGTYEDTLKQDQINGDGAKVQQNILYKDSALHVYKTGYLWCITSTDHGKTWNHPKDITPQVKKDDDMGLLIAPGHGITTSDGTIVIGAYKHPANVSGERASILYSTDNGMTWERTGDVATQSSENDIVELEDGTLRMFYRSGVGHVCYADFVKKADGSGYDVKTPVHLESLPITANNLVTAISYSKKINGKQAILFASAEGPNRTNGRIYVFLVNDEDENNTMTFYHKFVVPNSTVGYHYSSITELPDGSIGLLWENDSAGHEIRFDKLNIMDIIPGAAIEGAYVNVAIDEDNPTYTRIYAMTAEAPQAMSEPAAKVANMEITDSDAYYMYPMHSHATGGSAFDTGQISYADLSKAEFTFTANGANWRISNYDGTTTRYLGIRDWADNMVNTNVVDMVVNWDKETNTAKLQKNNFSIVFYDAVMAFNSSNQAAQGGCHYNFTFWKKAADGTGSTELPGYEKYTGENFTEGSYLVTYINDEGTIYYIHPENGSAAMTKRIVKRMAPHKQMDRTVMISLADESGNTKAAADGVTYNIRARKQKTFEHYMQVGDKMTLTPPSPYTKAEADEIVSENTNNDYLSVEVSGLTSSGKTPLFNRTTTAPSSLDAYATTSNASINIEEAEFLFTKRESGTWDIYNTSKAKYFTCDGAANYFQDNHNSSGVTIEPWDHRDGDMRENTFYFHAKTNFCFWLPQMNFNGNAPITEDVLTKGRHGMTLLKKTGILSENDMLPGYVKATEVEDGGTYLITYLWEKEGKEYLFVLHPTGGQNNQSKLAALTEPTPLYDHVEGVGTRPALSPNYQTVSRTGGADISKAELMFTEENAKWYAEVKGADGQLWYFYPTSSNAFTTTKKGFTVEQNGSPYKLKLLLKGEGTDGRYVGMFNTSSNQHPKYTFGASSSPNDETNAQGSNYVTLLEKTDFSAENILPGYKVADAPVSGKKYLITYVYGDGNVLVLYPNALSYAHTNSKLAYAPNRIVTITATDAGETSYTLGGEEHKVKVRPAGECDHSDTQIVNDMEADDCLWIFGYTGDKICTLCGEVIEKGHEIVPTGHDWDMDSGVYVAPTADTDGSITYTCKRDPKHTQVTPIPSSVYRAVTDALEKANKMLGTDKALYNGDFSSLQAAYNEHKDFASKVASEKMSGQDMVQIATVLRGAMNPFTSDRDRLVKRWTDLKADADKIEQGNLSDTDWSAFTAKRDAVTNVATTSYANLTAAISGLADAMDKLEVAGAKADLRKLYDQYKDLAKGDYTDGTWALFDQKRAAAKTAIDNPNATADELDQAKRDLEDAYGKLKTNAQEQAERQLAAPASISYTAPEADAYPSAAVVLAKSDDTKASAAISDRTGGSLTKKNNDSVSSIVNQEGIWSFNDQMMSDSTKYDVTGDGNAMVFAFKFYLGIINSNTSEILGKGDQYALRIENRDLVMTVGEAKEKIDLAGSMRNNWHDVVMLVDGKGNQHLYLDGEMSETVSGAGSATLVSDTSPFTIGYNAKVDGNELSATVGRLADIKFYRGAVELPTDYTVLTSVLAGNPPTAYITVAPYTTQTVWESAGGEAVAPGLKFAEKTVYKATTTFAANDAFEFKTDDAFIDEVKAAVVTGVEEGAEVAVAVPDAKTMTVTVTYPATGESQGGGDEPNPPSGDDKDKEALDKAKAELADALAKAEALVKAGQGSYTKDSWDAFLAAYNAAVAGKDGGDLTALKDLTGKLTSLQSGLAYAIKVGDYVDIKYVRYTVTDVVNRTVMVEKATNKKKVKTVTIPATVTINGVECKVTEIKAKAFVKCTKLKKLTIGANVTKIGKQAFFKCTKLKTVIFNGAKIAKAEKKSFGKISPKVKVKFKGLSTADKKAVKNALKKSGINKKAIK